MLYICFFIYKAVQTLHGGLGSAFGRSPLSRDTVRPMLSSRGDARERIGDLRDEMASLAGEKIECETGWRARVSISATRSVFQEVNPAFT